jgi:uncharacterized SAM-binding protein YcdF (DUF218 family)
MAADAIDTDAKTLYNYLCMHQTPQKSDAIFVLCSFDLRVAHRAVELYKQGYGAYIIFSGNGAGRLTAKIFEKTEAETFADIARQAGVPEDHIIIENEATNSGENIQFTHTLLKERGIGVNSLLLVQKPYMERRAYATFRKQWPDPNTQITITSPQIDYEALPDGTIDKQYLIEAMVGDMQRVKVYGENGWQIPQAIPDKVWKAYERLVQAGFTRRVISDIQN